jgi:hypothetical protein
MPRRSTTDHGATSFIAADAIAAVASAFHGSLRILMALSIEDA